MKIAVLGTGMVGRTIAAKLTTLGHDVALGTRDPEATLARIPPQGQISLSDWLATHEAITLTDLASAAVHGEWVIFALNGKGTLDGLTAAGTEAIGDKIVLDVSNPLEFSRDMPPSLFISNTDSLAEMIQRILPNARVVKTLNTVNANVMVDPAAVADGDHTMFVCGNDPDARSAVARFLTTEFGWRDVIDLGDLTAARGMEASLHLWLKLWGAIGHPGFGIKVVR